MKKARNVACEWRNNNNAKNDYFRCSGNEITFGWTLPKCSCLLKLKRAFGPEVLQCFVRFALIYDANGVIPTH